MNIQSHPEKAAPAFQEYASDLLADRNFKMMSLSERGLLYTLKCECWVNRVIPADPEDLAKYLGLQPNDIKGGLTRRVLGFFTECNGDMLSPELERYRQQLEARRQRQSMGGAKGGKTTQAKNKKVQAILETKLQGSIHGDSGGNVKVLSRVESSRVEKNTNESTNGSHVLDKDWARAYGDNESGFVGHRSENITRSSNAVCR